MSTPLSHDRGSAPTEGTTPPARTPSVTPEPVAALPAPKKPAQKKERMAWPDIAKGISILGVVLLHSCIAVPGGMGTWQAAVNHLLDSLRMPLFFLISGFFSVKVFRMTMLELWVKRLWFFVVPYIIWVPIEQGIKFREYNNFDGTPMPGWQTYLDGILYVTNMYWFLAALIAFNLVLWATRRLPWWAGLAVGFLPVLVLPLHQEYHMVGKAVLYLPLFLAGAHLRDKIMWLTQSFRNPRVQAGVIASFLVGVSILLWWRQIVSTHEVVLAWFLPGAEVIDDSGLQLVVTVVAQLFLMPSAILGAMLLAKTGRLSRALQWLGRNTLVIYLGHPIAITLIFHYFIRSTQWVIEVGDPRFMHAASTWVFFAFAAASAGAVVLYVISKTPVLKWTINPPSLAPLVFGTQRKGRR